jgi:3-oxoacyl-[acyl-carrier-protein] synthase III
MLVGCGRALFQRNGLSIDDVDWLLPMQSHARRLAGERGRRGFHPG